MNLTKYKFIPLSQENIKEAIDFLIPQEESCVTLLSRIIDGMPNELFSYYILCKTSNENSEYKICGVIMISKGGLIQHHFENPTELENSIDFQNQLKILLENKNLYCIMGDKNGSKLLIKTISKIFNNKLPYENREYLLLKYHPEYLPDFPDEKTPEFSELVHCDISNLEDL